MSTQVKIQVPIDKDVRDGLEKLAHSYGFDSVQAYIRVWAKAQVDGRVIDFAVDDWGQPTDAAAERLDKAEAEALRDLKAGKLKKYYTAEEFMKDLSR